MSDARDELAKVIRESTKRSLFGERYAGVPEVADAILAAGYSNPRTISTVEELDQLPAGSVILRNGRAFQHYPAHSAPFDEYQKWKCADGGFVRSTKDGSSILPATVLYEPKP